MTARLVRKPPAGTGGVRFKIELPGFQSIKHKIEQGMLSKYYLLHEQGIYHAGLTSIYMELLDPEGHPLLYFSDGRKIADYSLVIDAPYPCAADHYDNRGPAPPSLRF